MLPCRRLVVASVSLCHKAVSRVTLPRVSFASRFRNYSSAGPAPVTKIEKLILDNIKAAGPISFASYMQLCLSHPTDGYYMNPSHAVFGSKGDFITSPEISQVFGELVGIWLLSQWMAGGQSCKGIRLVELGPGRGTLMDDIIRVINQFPASRAALKSVHLIDNSLAMQEVQKMKLLPAARKGKFNLAWHESLDEVPKDTGEYTMLIAHEFFDALPINVLERTEQGWHEVLISDIPAPVAAEPSDGSAPLPPPPSLDTPTGLEPRLRLVLTPSPTPTSTILGLSSPRYQTVPVKSRIEVSHASFKVARKIGELLGSSAGSALIIDYGGDKAYDNSFRAFKQHEIVDIFHRPGECDLTANVDFAYLKEAFTGLATSHGPLPQGEFLNRMGLEMRVDNLKRAAKSEDRKVEIDKATERLVDPLGMGMEYQVLGVTQHDNGEESAGTVWPFMGLEEGAIEK